MKNLDWKKINNDKDFQRLVNDLFALEINHPSFLSSNPEIGADGGWDGRYSGKYMQLEGIWNFQAKWTKHNLNEAYKQLREELKKELEKAKKNKVQFLLLATNADLKVGTDDHIGKLEKLNKNKKYVEKLFIWPRANLESKIVKYSFLRNLYFGDPQEPMFVPPQAYIKSESSLCDVFVGRDKELTDFKTIINDEKANLYILHTGGGYGKTHFIIELAKKINNLLPNFLTWFCRPGIRDINEAINELDHDKDNIIFLDDAERYLEDAKKIISHTKTFSPGNLKIILSCRTSGKEILKNLADIQRIDSYNEFELPQLPDDELIKILIHTAETKTIKHPERIVKELNGNLYLIVTTGKLIKGGVEDPKKIKRYIKNNIEHEAITALKEYLIPLQIKKLLRELSIIVPFYNEPQNSVIEKLSLLLKLDNNLISEIIDNLIEAKILRLVGKSVRFNPDMKGDIYLSVELDNDNTGKLANQMFENWLPILPKQLTSNIAAASRHLDIKMSSEEAVKTLIKEWINEASKTPDLLRATRLELITPVSFLAPEESINLVHAYIDLPNKEKDIYTLNSDSYGPIIYQVLHIPGLQESVLKLIKKISDKNISGTYDNYKPTRLIQQITSPIEVNINLAITALNELKVWVDNDKCTIAEIQLVCGGVKEALAGSHKFTESYGNQFTFGRKSLLYNQQYKKVVDKYRDTGMSILKKIIFHPNNKIKVMGINLVVNIGDETGTTENDFWKRIILDKNQAIEWLKELIQTNPSHEILSSIENALIRFWTNNNLYTDLSQKAAKILNSYPRTPEFIIFQYFVAHDTIITDFKILEDSAPEKDRWSWLVHNHFRLRGFKQEIFEQVVKEISNKYKTIRQIIEYLKLIEIEIDGISQWQYIPLIETWSRFNSSSFIEIANNQLSFQKIPERFHLGIYRACSDKDNKYVNEYAEIILSDLDNLQLSSVDNLLDLISQYKTPTDEFMPWLYQIIEKASGNIKNIILHRTLFIFQDRTKEEKNLVFSIIENVLNGSINNRTLDMIEFLLSNAIKWNVSKTNLNKIRDLLFEIIKDQPSIEYHADELLKFVFNKNIDKFIAFVEYRLTKYNTDIEIEKANEYDPIPYDGFRSSEGLIKNYNDFQKLMDKINYWRNEEILYSSDLDNILKYSNGGDDEHPNYLKNYIEEKIKQGDADNLRVSCNALLGIELEMDTADLFLNLLLSSEKAGILKEAKEVFSHQVFSGSYTSSIGQVPPHLVNKKDVLINMHQKCPAGSIKNYLDAQIKSINSDIQDHLDRDEEFMSQK